MLVAKVYYTCDKLVTVFKISVTDVINHIKVWADVYFSFFLSGVMFTLSALIRKYFKHICICLGLGVYLSH